MRDILEQDIKIFDHINHIPQYEKNNEPRIIKKFLKNNIDSYVCDLFNKLLPTSSHSFAMDVGIAWMTWRNRRNISSGFDDLQTFLIQQNIPIRLKVVIDENQKEEIFFSYDQSSKEIDGSKLMTQLKRFNFNDYQSNRENASNLLNGHHSLVVQRVHLKQQLLKDLSAFSGSTDCVLFDIHKETPLMVFVDPLNQNLVSRVGFLVVNIQSEEGGDKKLAAMDLIYVD